MGQVPQAAVAGALANLDYNSAVVSNPPGARTVGSVVCDPGQRVVGGGIKVDDVGTQFIIDSFPLGTGGWQGTVENPGGATANFTVFVICTSSVATS